MIALDPNATTLKTCPCGKALSRLNRSGLCRKCFPKTKIKVRVARFCDCGKQITRHSRSGKCRDCAMSSPEVAERRTAGIRAAYLHNPEYRERQRRWMGELNRRPEARARASEQASRIKLWEYGLPMMTPEVRSRQARTLSERKLAHIPPEVRDEYRRLVARDFGAAEAERIVLEHHAKQMERFAVRIGGEPLPPSPPAPEVAPKKPRGRPRKRFPRSCACGQPINYRNTSGWCKRCAPVQRVHGSEGDR